MHKFFHEKDNFAWALIMQSSLVDHNNTILGPLPGALGDREECDFRNTNKPKFITMVKDQNFTRITANSNSAEISLDVIAKFRCKYVFLQIKNLCQNRLVANSTSLWKILLNYNTFPFGYEIYVRAIRGPQWWQNA